MNVRPERGRLNVSPPAGGRLPVTNGLEWDLEALIVTDKDGQPFFATGIPAGAEAELSPAGRDNREAFLELMSRSAPRMPEELRNRRDATKLNIGPTYRRYWGNREDFHVSQGQMEQRISAIRDDINNADLLPSNTWLAITRDAPSIEFGTSVKVADEWHLVVGYY